MSESSIDQPFLTSGDLAHFVGKNVGGKSKGHSRIWRAIYFGVVLLIAGATGAPSDAATNLTPPLQQSISGTDMIIGPQTIQVEFDNQYAASTPIYIDFAIAGTNFINPTPSVSFYDKDSSGALVAITPTGCGVTPNATHFTVGAASFSNGFVPGNCVAPAGHSIAAITISGMYYGGFFSQGVLTPGQSIQATVTVGNPANTSTHYEVSTFPITTFVNSGGTSSTYTLSIGTPGSGSGTVTASPTGPSYAAGTVVTLTATAASGSAFVGWTGACSSTAATCQVTMNSNQTVAATFNSSSPSQYTLSTATTGTGSGTITSSPSGSTYAAGTVVTLTATPANGSAFAGWSGACSGTATTCQVTMNSNQSASATFNTSQNYTLTTSTLGTGSGTVSASPTGPSYAAGTVVTLTATAASGSVFAGWSGYCGGTATTCQVTVNADKSVQAIFNTLQNFTLGTATTGTGSGTIAASPPGPSYAAGTAVTLTATPASGSVFAGWSGACSGTATTCQVTMNSNQSVSATFNTSQNYTLTTGTTGTGSGTITANPTGPNYTAGAVVTLTATPASGSVFAGWSGACSGTATSCQITMNSNQSVTATFNTALTVALRVGAVFSTLQSDSQSFLRFYNTGTTAGTVTVTLSDYTTGQLLGQWTSPSIPVNAAPQYSMGTVESGLTPGFTKPQYYSIAVQSGITGYMQHVLWRPNQGSFSNLSTCNTGVTTNSDKLNNVHSSAIDYGYPSTVIVNNTGTAAETVTLGIYGAADGAKLGTYATASIPSGGQTFIAMKTIETALNITPGSVGNHYVVKAEGTFTGFLQHLVENVQASVLLDLTTVCALPPPS